MSGIVNVYKPAGVTSAWVINQIKRKFPKQKIGHLGTLDPSGVGVLPICVGKATKLFDYFLNKKKVYRAVFVFGKTTDSLDSDGKITESEEVEITVNEILSVLPSFIGKSLQMPPRVSAKKVNGKRAYDLARENIQFELQPKEIEIYGIDLVKEICKNTFLFEIECSSGTYIRSIVRDLATKLNTIGYMGAIIRLQSGDFKIGDSCFLDEINEKTIIPIPKILESMQKLFISEEFYDKIINGVNIPVENNYVNNLLVFCKNELIGIGVVTDNKLKIITNLREKYD